MILSSDLLLVALGFGIASVALKYQSLRTRWRRYQEGQVTDPREKIQNARAKVRRWERRVDDSRRHLSQAKAELAQTASDGAAAGVSTPEGREAQRLAAARSAGSSARAEALRLQREDYSAAVPDDYPHRWLGCPERFAQKSLSELWRANGLCIACGVRAARDSWHAHCYETCSPKRRHHPRNVDLHLAGLSDDRPLPDPPPPPLRTKAPSRSEAISMIQLMEEQNRRDGEARKWPECSSCGDILRRRTARRHCLRCRPPGKSGTRAHLPDLIRAQRGACGICSKPLPIELDDIHVDHIIPRAHGGTDSVDNLQATHAHCNLSKGAKLESRE